MSTPTSRTTVGRTQRHARSAAALFLVLACLRSACAAEGDTTALLTADHPQRPVYCQATDMLFYAVGTSANGVRRFHVASGVDAAVAGNATAGGYTDDFGASARFGQISAMDIDGACLYLYVADSTNNRIRRVRMRDLSVSTIAGTGSATRADGNALTQAGIPAPNGLALSPDERFLFVLTGKALMRLDLAASQVITFAGSDTLGHDAGYGTLARLYGPWAIGFIDSDTMLVTEKPAVYLRRVSIKTGYVEFIYAGVIGQQAMTNGFGTDARLVQPSFVASYPAARIGFVVTECVTDGAYKDFVIRKVNFTSGYVGNVPLPSLAKSCFSGVAMDALRQRLYVTANGDGSDPIYAVAVDAPARGRTAPSAPSPQCAGAASGACFAVTGGAALNVDSGGVLLVGG